MICFAISILISAPSFADPDISSSASSANCRNDPLETYSGTSNLQANWQANEIYLEWYDGDEELAVPDESLSCVYDGTLTPPPAPTKTGYTFKGWRVRPEIWLINLDLDTSINGTDYGYASIGGGDAYNANAYGLTSDSETGEWAVTFSYGIIKGEAYCVSYSGTSMCTCSIIRYTPISSEQTYAVKDRIKFKNSLSACESNCTQYCAQTYQTDSDVRARAFIIK